MAALVNERFAATNRVKVIHCCICFCCIMLLSLDIKSDKVDMNMQSLIVQVIQEDFTRCHLRSHLSSFLGSDYSEVDSYAKVKKL